MTLVRFFDRSFGNPVTQGPFVQRNIFQGTSALNLFDEFDRALSSFGATTNSRSRNSQVGAYDFSEFDEHYLMSVDLPGVDREEIKLEIKDNHGEKTLTVEANRKKDLRFNERIKGTTESPETVRLSRQFSLPQNVDGEKIEAHYENGVLDLYLPKFQEAKPREIKIESKKSGFFEKILGAPEQVST